MKKIFKIKSFLIPLLAIIIFISSNISAETFDLEKYTPTESEKNIINLMSSDNLPSDFIKLNRDVSINIKLIEDENGEWVTKSSSTFDLKKDSLIYIKLKGNESDSATLYIAASNKDGYSSNEFPTSLRLGKTLVSSFLDKNINISKDDQVIASFQTSDYKDINSLVLSEVLNNKPQKDVEEALVVVSLSQE